MFVIIIVFSQNIVSAFKIKKPMIPTRKTIHVDATQEEDMEEDWKYLFVKFKKFVAVKGICKFQDHAQQ
jgi:hypothetical protein